MEETEKLARFEQAVSPHLDAAHNLARWLVRSDADAEDLVQESFLRAFRFFGSFRGGDARAWLLTIVRNCCYSWLKRNPAAEAPVEIDEKAGAAGHADPEALLLRAADGRSVQRALEELPAEFREVVVLRELEGFSYKEIAEIAAVPIGTVMSRLARARERLQRRLAEEGLR